VHNLRDVACINISVVWSRYLEISLEGCRELAHPMVLGYVADSTD